eukprot:gene31741-6941_t
MDESKEPMMSLRKKECMEWLEDYNECLHRDKARLRDHLVERERRRQVAEAAAAVQEHSTISESYIFQLPSRGQQDSSPNGLPKETNSTGM